MFFFIRKQARKPVFNTVSSLFATAFVGIIKTGRLAAGCGRNKPLPISSKPGVARKAPFFRRGCRHRRRGLQVAKVYFNPRPFGPPPSKEGGFSARLFILFDNGCSVIIYSPAKSFTSAAWAIISSAWLFSSSAVIRGAIF